MLALHELTLQSAGHRTTLCSSGPEALEALGRVPPGAVLLDINMPGMNGLEVLGKIREQFTMAQMPVLMVTGEVDPQYMIDALGSGANDYVPKDAPAEVLLAKLRIQLELAGQLFDSGLGLASAPSLDPRTGYCPHCIRILSASDEDCGECRVLRPESGWPEIATSEYPWLGNIVGGKYCLERLIGRGVAATVYRARHVDLDRLLAVKLIDLSRSEFASLINRDRVQAEALAMAHVDSPHVVKVVEVLEPTRGVFALVMDYVHGRTLRRVLASTRPPLRDTVDLAIQVARGLAAAHNCNLVHRDIKPENIMISDLTGGGYFAHLVDFGIVRPAAGDPVSTNFVVGTPLYMSPEQACGLTEVDGRLDQYSLGCVVYEMITGRPPFVDDDPQVVLRRQVLEAPAPLSDARPQTPASFEQLVGRMLAKNPRHRFPTMELFIREAQAVREGLP